MEMGVLRKLKPFSYFLARLVIVIIIACLFILLFQSKGSHKFKQYLQLNHLLPNFSNVSSERDEGAIESRDVPLRGVGDSMLPFQDLIVGHVKETPTDIFKENLTDISDADIKKQKLKKILFWNEFIGLKHFGLGFGREPFLRAKCPVNTCFATGDRKRFKSEEIDAILWHFRSDDRSLPSQRSPHTRFVFWMMESASYQYGSVDHFRDTFNWTFTYKADSDFPLAYDRIYRRRTPVEVTNYHNVTLGKTKHAAWFVSHCGTASKREKFVDELKKYVNVDIYGTCGPLKCPKSEHWTTCYRKIEKNYKFYLAFENSLCQDYVTEKFFDALKFFVVPVVYGFGNYSAIAPPHSYVNALDFASAKKLADYLIYLDKNDTAYNEYFQWKKYHHFTAKWSYKMTHWCELCRRLHTDNKTKTYDLHQWFTKDSHCRNSFQEARKYLTQN